MMIMPLDFLIREPAEVYHARAKDFLTSHTLNDFRRCPLLYRRKEQGLIPERDTSAYVIGRAAHTLILEGRQRYEREYAIGGPINPKTKQPYGSTTKAFAEWAEKQSKPVLSDSHAALVEQMAAAIREHQFAHHLLSDGVAEGVVRCRYGDFDCQARIDWIGRDPEIGIVDLKTADELDSFELAARAFGYLHQMAFYHALVVIAGEKELTSHIAGEYSLPVHIVAVEKREPFRVGVWRIAPAVLDQAQAHNEEAMGELLRCRTTGDWFTRFEEVRVIDHL